MKNSQKGFANIALIVVIIAIIAVGGYFVFSKKSQQPSSEPVSTTANLQTYKNDKYGLELKYPNNYSLTENKTGISISSSQSCQKILGTGGGQWPKDCFIYDLLIQKNKIEGGSAHIASTKVVGYSSEKFELDGGMYDNMNQIYIQFEKDGNWYISYVTYHSENKIEAENLLNQILSTFKFTGQEISQTSNQKIYKNNTYGFSFSYPADFKLSTDLSAGEKTKVSSYIPVCNDGDVVCLYYIGGGYENTNFGAAGIDIQLSTAPTKTECLKTITTDNTATDKVVINGITFYHDLGGGAALGHSTSDDTYRTYFNGACYSVVAKTTETSYENLRDANPNLKRFDETALRAKLKSIVSSFRFTISETVSPKETIPKPITLVTFNDGKVTFSYPSDRQVIWSRADGFGIGKIEKIGLNENTEYDITFTVDGRTMDQIKKVLMYNGDGSVNTSNTVTNITIGGENGILDSTNGKPSIIFVPHNGVIYQISVSFAPADMYSTFVSTFRFLN